MKTKVLCLVTLATATLLIFSCEKKRTEVDLAKDIRDMDTFLRRPSFHYDSLEAFITNMQETLIHDEQKELSYDAWKTSVTYRWNADSSIVMIEARKVYPVGFSRETIVHTGDSILFVHRFSTEPLGLGNRDRPTLLESIFYLTEMGTIKHLARISYNIRDLSDTVAFRKKPFADLTDDVSHYYSLELNHSKNILTLN